MAKETGAAAQFVAAQFGGNFRVRQSVQAVGLASVTVAPNDGDRVALNIINIGTTAITLSFAPSAVSGQGILLLDNGSVYTVNVRDDAILPAWAHQAISAAIGGSLLVIETTLESKS